MVIIVRKLRSFLALSGEERWTFLISLLLLPALAVALQRIGMRRTRSWLEHHVPPVAAPSASDAATRAPRMARMVNAAARRSPYKANCLKRSLALWWLLRRRGIDSELRIGVRKKDNALQAHAWIELGGVVLNDSLNYVRTFTPFAGDVMSVYRFLD
ncbi:MAG: lasso peptide biosynthesis B2 protein [Chloroflexi bacterium]|nr:lasso peptide biosynthesis B2 protein [Chloroflexota bacterium]